MTPTDGNELGGLPAGGGSEAIKARVRDFILDNIYMNGSTSDIGNDTSFIETNTVDSVGFIEIIAFLEESFGIEVLDEEMVPENLDSLNRVALFVARKRGS